mmetsp:Transcript_11257/g.25030  ORF Transcript_11257/g.25030 Transcript_11257/m.25030 type:complete len:225 (+) Transcript_11257:463-1137(+)
MFFHALLAAPFAFGKLLRTAFVKGIGVAVDVFQDPVGEELRVVLVYFRPFLAVERPVRALVAERPGVQVVHGCVVASRTGGVAAGRLRDRDRAGHRQGLPLVGADYDGAGLAGVCAVVYSQHGARVCVGCLAPRAVEALVHSVGQRHLPGLRKHPTHKPLEELGVEKGNLLLHQPHARSHCVARLVPAAPGLQMHVWEVLGTLHDQWLYHQGGRMGVERTAPRG